MIGIRKVEFERIKTLEGRYNRIRVSEEDVFRFAKTIARFAKNDDENFKILVESSDGKEIFISHDPEFFLCDEMPTEIRLVSIEYSCYKTSTECTLKFNVSANSPVELRVKGSGPEILGLFSDLEKEFASKQIFGHRILDVADRYWFGLGLSALLAAAIYFIFDVWLDFWNNTFPEFGGSVTQITISSVGWSAILITIITGPLWIENATKKFISPIEFYGRISDPGAKSRKIRIYFFTIILLPLLISFMPSVAFNLFSLVLDVYR